jgi:hypothetical protein
MTAFGPVELDLDLSKSDQNACRTGKRKKMNDGAATASNAMEAVG